MFGIIALGTLMLAIIIVAILIYWRLDQDIEILQSPVNASYWGSYTTSNDDTEAMAIPLPQGGRELETAGRSIHPTAMQPYRPMGR
jgi:hypothetical protein